MIANQAVSQLALSVFALAAPSLAGWNDVAYVDSQGREWRQLDLSCGLTWNQVAAMCPTDGQGPCEGAINNVSIDGWTWANQVQVIALLKELEATVANGCVTGADVNGDVFNHFRNSASPENGFFVQGWTSTPANVPGIGDVAVVAMLGFDIDYGLGMTCSNILLSRSQSEWGCGVWLFREAACPADVDRSGWVDGADLALMLSAWGPASSSLALDLSGDGVIDGADLSVLLASWGSCGD